ncbi:hypothetical protein H0H92_005571 [Tricholoma furcatifolium]|nr:hypothetical protein H0H92_005571 [Tricholoma furcatifolium]
MSIFTEASYAAFLFGGGVCEVCKQPTDAPYCSYGIRLRDPCKREFAFIGVYRASDSLREMEIHKASKDTYLEFCIKLREWNEYRQVLQMSIKTANETFAKRLASDHDWDCYDMLNSTVFGRIHRLKCKRIEAVTQEDYNQVASQVGKSLAKLAITREQRTRNLTYKKNRDDVEKHYQKLRSQQPPITLPSLEVFRHLSIVQMLQGTSPSTVEYSPKEEVRRVSNTLRKEEWVIKRLDTELRQWTAKARSDLGAVLGFPVWTSASTKILHPVDRITARFICKLCASVASRYSQDESLDFAGACAHTCRTAKKDKRFEATWSAERFVKDEKTIAALDQLLALCGVDGSLAGADTALEALGATIVCTSCTPELILDTRSAAGHSHRHEKMEMRLVSKPEADDHLLPYSFQPSLVRRLYGSQVRLKRIREMKNFGCRHCFMLERQAKPVASTEAIVLGQTNARAKHNVARSQFTFGGVKDHLSKKHGINNVRDEDIFSFAPIEFPSK